jgi:hypothetical protein
MFLEYAMERSMKEDVKMTRDEVALARERRFEAMRLQEIEGNPLSAEDIAMFEMFEREGWSHEHRRTYILKQAKADGV